MTVISKLNSLRETKVFKSVCVGFVCLVGFLAIFSFVKTPFTGDIRVFMAAANQVKYQDANWFMSIWESWELKGIGNRFLMYIIYLLADTTVGFENKIIFQYVCKLVYAVFLVIMLFASVYLSRITRKEKVVLFSILYFVFFTTGVPVHMQAEMTCVAICTLSVACIIHNKRWSFILAGFLGATLFFFKSVFVLLFGSVLLIIVLYNNCVKKEIKVLGFVWTILSMLMFELLFLVTTFFVYPQEFRDMIHASEYQSTMLSEGSSISLHSLSNSLYSNFTVSVVYIPFLILGAVTTIFVIMQAIKQKEHITWITLTALWVISIDIIVVSNNYFVYHYFLLAIPAIVSVVLYFNWCEESLWISIVAMFLALSAVTVFNLVLGKEYEIGVFNNSTVMLVYLHLFLAAFIVFALGKYKNARIAVGFFAMTISCFFWVDFLSALAPYYRNVRTLDWYSYALTESALPKDICEQEILFLEAGNAAFYIDAPSYSRYFFNLPLQRWKSGEQWEWKDDEYEKIIEYQGKYIIIDYNWFLLDKYPELKSKLQEEYTKIPCEKLRFYSPSWNVFSIADYGWYTGYENINLCILERK